MEKLYCKNVVNQHIQVFTDSTVAISCINRMGSCKPELNEVTREIWLFCLNRQLFISIFHIPGKENVRADKLSRDVSHMGLEWKLNEQVFNDIVNIFGSFNLDLFASRINFQMKPYVSWFPDPEAFVIDAFSFNWGPYFCYCFPPFNMILNVLQKLSEDESEKCLIVPLWKAQPFFPVLGNVLIQHPMILPNRSDILIHTQKL